MEDNEIIRKVVERVRSWCDATEWEGIPSDALNTPEKVAEDIKCYLMFYDELTSI